MYQHLRWELPHCLSGHVWSSGCWPGLDPFSSARASGETLPSLPPSASLPPPLVGRLSAQCVCSLPAHISRRRGRCGRPKGNSPPDQVRTRPTSRRDCNWDRLGDYHLVLKCPKRNTLAQAKKTWHSSTAVYRPHHNNGTKVYYRLSATRTVCNKITIKRKASKPNQKTNEEARIGKNR